MKKRHLIAILILSCVLFMALKVHIDGIQRKKIPGSSIIYLPSGENLKYTTFGYHSLAADIIYLWAIQYYSTPEIQDRFDYLEHIFSIINTLDPHYLDPYEIGAIIAVYEAKDYDLGFRILEKGMENNPDEWLLPFEAGHYAQSFLKDFTLARKYYKKAMEIEGAPPHTARLYANAAFETMDYQTSLESWKSIFETAEDERTKKIADNHLYRVEAAMDIQAIQEALEAFRARYSRLPDNLSQLVRSGFLNELPKDRDGRDYVYDSRTGEVKTAVIPWKR